MKKPVKPIKPIFNFEEPQEFLKGKFDLELVGNSEYYIHDFVKIANHKYGVDIKISNINLDSLRVELGETNHYQPVLNVSFRTHNKVANTQYNNQKPEFDARKEEYNKKLLKYKKELNDYKEDWLKYQDFLKQKRKEELSELIENSQRELNEL